MSVDPKEGYDKAFDHVVRLRIMAVLMANEQFDFTSFKELLQVTDGNLASHLKHLEQAEFVRVEKSFVGRKPMTQYAATQKGKSAFQSHLYFLEELIRSSQT